MYFVEVCINTGHSVDVYYGKKDMKALFFSYLKKRKYSNSVTKKVKSSSIKNITFFKNKKVSVSLYKNLNAPSAISKIQKGEYDILVTALDQILSKKFIAGVNSKIVNVHYGMLPEIKGTSALEWTYFKHKKCEITLHYIDVGIDTGSIISKKEIPIPNPLSFSKLRSEVQQYIPKILHEFLNKIANNESLNTLANGTGDLHTFMHLDLVKILEKRNEHIYNT